MTLAKNFRKAIEYKNCKGYNRCNFVSSEIGIFAKRNRKMFTQKRRGRANKARRWAAPVGLLTLAVCLGSSSAKAGTWKIEHSASGTIDLDAGAISPYNSTTFPATTTGGYSFSLTRWGNNKAIVSATLTYTLTWIPDEGKTNETDPPPKKIWVTEQSSATAQGGYGGGSPSFYSKSNQSASNAIGDPAVSPSIFATSITSKTDPPRITVFNSSSGLVNVPARSLSASSS